MTAADDGSPVFPLPRPRHVLRIDTWHPNPANTVRFQTPLTVHGASATLCSAALAAEVHPADPDRAQIVVRSARAPEVDGELGYYMVVLARPAGQVTICADDEQGVRAALQTLRQMFRALGPALPPVEIADWPAFPTRGVMLDVSRCRIPTMNEFHRIVPTLASLKFNHLQLYTEHTFAYRDHEQVWSGWDPITPAEIRELSALCNLHGITLAANQNCFGHMKHWLDHPRYAPLAETHDDFEFYGMSRRGPFSLCPTDPAALDLVRGLLDELVPNFTADPSGRRLVNIGCDETADVGAGRSRDAVSARGKPAVYAEFVAGIMQHAIGRGWVPQFWADIATEHAEVLRLLPPQAIPLAWGYEPDSPFEKWGTALAQSGREWWVCPGTSSWRSITGRTQERRANIEAAARAGVAHGATGFMVCDWGDTGHLQQWPIALNALAQAADAAWTGGEPGYDPAAASLHALGDHTLHLGTWLDELGDADTLIRTAAATPPPGVPALRNASALFTHLWPARPELIRPGALGSPDHWTAVAARLEQLAASRPRLRGPHAGLLSDEIEHTVRFAQTAARAAGALSAPAGLSEGARVRLRNQLIEIEAEHIRLWPARSRLGGLAQSREFFAEARARL